MVKIRQHIDATAYFTTILSSNIRLVKQRWQRRQKRNRVRLAKQQLCTCIMLFCTFLSSHCTTSTQKCLISHFVEDGNTKQQLCFPFPELWFIPLEFNSKKICQHLTNETKWNIRRKKVWDRANSLFRWCSRSRHCCH